MRSAGHGHSECGISNTTGLTTLACEMSGSELLTTNLHEQVEVQAEATGCCCHQIKV